MNHSPWQPTGAVSAAANRWPSQNGVCQWRRLSRGRAQRTFTVPLSRSPRYPRVIPLVIPSRTPRSTRCDGVISAVASERPLVIDEQTDGPLCRLFSTRSPGILGSSRLLPLFRQFPVKTGTGRHPTRWRCIDAPLLEDNKIARTLGRFPIRRGYRLIYLGRVSGRLSSSRFSEEGSSRRKAPPFSSNAWSGGSSNLHYLHSH